MSEPVTRVFDRMALSPFSLEATAEAVQKPLATAGVPLELAADAVDALWQVTEGHPFFTAFAMRDIVRREAGPGRRPALRDADIHRVWPAIAAHRVEERFAVEAGCTPAERDLLTSRWSTAAPRPYTSAREV